MKRLTAGTQFLEIASPQKPFRFSSGESISSAHLAYETYGELSANADNVILLFPVLTTSQHAAGLDAAGPGTAYWNDTCHRGWWDDFIGPGKALDTDRFFVICANYIGGCFGSTGPSSVNPETKSPYGRSFPQLTVEDIVDSQVRLLQALSIDQLHAVVGASFGGYLAYDLARRYPTLVKRVISIASGCRVTSDMKHSNLSQMLAIENDRDFQDGRYGPDQLCLGLQLARLIALKTYIVADELEKNRNMASTGPSRAIGGYSLTHPSEHFFRRHAEAFVRRFDAHTYLRLLGAWQRFTSGLPLELGTDKTECGLQARNILEGCRSQKWILFSIDSDACFPPAEQRYLKSVLAAAEVPHFLSDLASKKGHDSFLVEPWLYASIVREFLDT